MSGKVFTRIAKPVSATPSRRSSDLVQARNLLVQERNPLVREPFRARPGQPLPNYCKRLINPIVA